MSDKTTSFTARLISRRRLLCALATAPGWPLLAHAATSTPAMQRIAALDWASAENLLALGITPLTLPEIDRYRQLVMAPPVPDSVHELGLRSEPNMELLQALRPEVMVMNPELASLQPQLEQIAPVLQFEAQGFAGDLRLAGQQSIDQVAHGTQALQQLAGQLGYSEQAAAYVTAADRQFADARTALADYTGRPLYLISLIDARRTLVFCSNSLFQDVFNRLGLQNAWRTPGSAFGHLTVTLDQLAADKDAVLVNIGNERLVQGALAMKIPVLNSLPAVQQKRVVLLPQTLFYGGLPSALRLTELLATRLPLAEGALHG
ncbi:ABC transporter substrate-binding protein [Pokkaliibacter sp. MBI-7]|uniref:ABC transporter substrate-binding protein n=1 Tax=Pokkaliibacter sp. MBI-7 TaxID=3040600 RepID=UPI002449E973|nr:ABC transporter substrate-binding protein [Pokkaliibacter sp. MBI-7]MDH2433797.1 ABC transporter substrate-binding protein [Pokkaliibacter sp. MBI-7]